jgi:hypothetical protein
MRKFVGGLLVFLAALALPATIPETRGALIALWVIVALLGLGWTLSSPIVLRPLGRALAPYVLREGITAGTTNTKAELRRAVVAVRDELSHVEILIARTLDSGEFPPPHDPDHRIIFPMGAWTNNSAHLSSEPTLDDAYDLAREAYTRVGNMNSGLRLRLPTTRAEAVDLRLSVTSSDRKELDQALAPIQSAVEALESARAALK